MSLNIKKDSVATVHYVLKDENKKVLDQSDKKNPLEYLHGTGAMLPGLEKALNGKKKGDKIKVTIKPEEGYGFSSPEMIQTVSKNNFQGVDKIEVGMSFETELENGQIQLATVTKVNGNDITIDTNHPLADKTLHFEIEVLDVRTATKEEIKNQFVG